MFSGLFVFIFFSNQSLRSLVFSSSMCAYFGTLCSFYLANRRNRRESLYWSFDWRCFLWCGKLVLYASLLAFTVTYFICSWCGAMPSDICEWYAMWYHVMRYIRWREIEFFLSYFFLYQTYFYVMHTLLYFLVTVLQCKVNIVYCVKIHLNFFFND